MDFVEPWVIRSALVIGLLAAGNVWLYVLSTRVSPQIPAPGHPRRQMPKR